MDVSIISLRVLRRVAEHGSFSGAAAASGYTQSAVSRQIAAAESAIGSVLFERRPDGVRLTAAGRTLLRHATRALDELDAAERELSTGSPERPVVRLGAFTSAGAWLVPRIATEVRELGAVELVTQTGSTRSMVAALRAGTLDVALLARTPPFRPFDDESPPLATRRIAEHELRVAVAATHPLASSSSVTVHDLVDQPWIAGRGSGGDPALGVWPGLPGRPRVMHTSSDWLTKLQLVASGAGLTTVPDVLLPVLPRGVRALRVRDGSHEQRQVFLARVPGSTAMAGGVLQLLENAALSAAAELTTT
jgi:DNA-binding transcriptional LysR family regulator